MTAPAPRSPGERAGAGDLLRRRARRSHRGAPSPVERAGAGDLLQLAYDFGPGTSQVGAVLMLDTTTPPDLAAVRAALEQRVRGVPRLRQRLRRTPPGCGRPVWLDDPDFDIRNHVRSLPSPAPGDQRALLDVAAATVAARLPEDRPLWAVTLVTGLAGGRSGLVLRFHHVVADGIGGLAVLAHLVDGAPAPAGDRFPLPAPSRRWLATDAFAGRMRALRGVPAAVPRVVAAIGQLRAGMTGRAPVCSLNRPTVRPGGPRRRLAVARADLAAVRDVAHRHGGTVNDVVLTAVAGAVHAFLLRRGETLDRLVVSVMVSGHVPGEADAVGNRTGVLPAVLPASGNPSERLRAIARLTRAAKSGPRGVTAAVLTPLFRAAGALRLVRPYINRQRQVNTFVTNLRGPAQPLSFMGEKVTDMIVVNAIAGNVAVSFGVLSYAGTLAVTIVADPERCPDVEELAGDLQRQLDVLTAAPPSPAEHGRHGNSVRRPA